MAISGKRHPKSLKHQGAPYRFKAVVAHNKARWWFGAHLVPFLTYAATGSSSELRHSIPEPLDLPNHAGNLVPSAPLGYIAGFYAQRAYTAISRGEDSPAIAKRKARAAMAGAGLAAGLMLNALAETRLGISVSHLANTPDTLDLAYGTAASVAGAAAGTNLQTVVVNPAGEMIVPRPTVVPRSTD